jgi:hypothetical protein
MPDISSACGRWMHHDSRIVSKRQGRPYKSAIWGRPAAPSHSEEHRLTHNGLSTRSRSCKRVPRTRPRKSGRLEGNSPGLATRDQSGGREVLARAFWARFNFLVIPAGSRKYGGGSCNPSVLRSYFTPACRASADMVRQPGAVRRTRGARLPHSGQADGNSHSAIGRSCVNGPHFLHIYSYVGIDHLPPAETHPAADQSVATVGTIPVDSPAVNVNRSQMR